VFIATAVSLWQNLEFTLTSSTQLVQGMVLTWIWSAYNLLIIGIALLTLLDIPKPDIYEWFDLRRVVCLTVEGKRLWGVTTRISEGGVEVDLNQAPIPEGIEKLPTKLNIMEEELELLGQITHISFVGEVPRVQVAFEHLSLPQYRRLVEMLFCRPGQWKRFETPGELRSLLLLFRSLLKPRVLCDRLRLTKQHS
jgi:cellulose synthase (UDP-forming)